MTEDKEKQFVNALRDPREPVGYSDGDYSMPIYKAKKGYLTTNAFIMCYVCKAVISTNGGPCWSAWCVKCTESKEYKSEHP